MERVDLLPPAPGADPARRDDIPARADAYAAVPLLNCLLREVAEPVRTPTPRPVYRLPGGRLLRVRAGRRPAEPELRAAGAWHRLGHAELVKLVAEELRRHTNLANHELPTEMTDSRDAVAALLTARARATPPDDPYLRSEQSLLTGHTHRDTTALDALGEAPPGYRLLPAHPWQLDLAAPSLAPAFADGRLIRLGATGSPVWPTAAIRTVYAPERDLFLKFSLDVRITNDIRRLWRHDLLKLRRTDTAATEAFAALGTPAAWLADRGHRTADFAYEELAVVVRDGFGPHLVPGATPLLAAALLEDLPDSPLANTTDPAAWWEAYLAAVVPPVLTAFAAGGVVVEAHLQNTVIAVDAAGTPVQALFRDAEGVKLLPDTSREAGWERLVYCLLVNHLLEIAAALTEHHRGFAPWPAVRRALTRHDLPEIPALLASTTLPGKTNLLLRWTGADGADARYLPVPNPLWVPVV
ncbi:IucA/IucC family protein [Streptomyces sp. FXJ7.023]|uniref:IucA/IucC family protein n=1 Tax=Streptomyces sp. FXJ7.023 TaxID=579932 RepID=UPI0003A8A7A9|nr:IucA/IucC family protein [Streptomyces sp. FXJ7.023]